MCAFYNGGGKEAEAANRLWYINKVWPPMDGREGMCIASGRWAVAAIGMAFRSVAGCGMTVPSCSVDREPLTSDYPTQVVNYVIMVR